MKAIILGLCLVAAVDAFLDANNLTVNTTIGQIRGVKRHLDSVNQDIFKFLGVPYALPPTGDRRFLRSEPMPFNADVFDASEFGAICPQDLSWMAVIGMPIPKVNISEDCLSLNVFVPAKPPDDGKPLATLIWIHGGALIYGTPSVYDPSDLATIGNVIVVTMNYRLGVLGFLTNEGKNCMGNYGLWDQRLAMVWVKNNIVNFGGDPSKVTLVGESSGAVCVSLHSLIPQNVGLFQHAISESGSALIPGGTVDSPKSWFHLFAQRINCEDMNGTKTSDEVMQCLRSKSSQEIFRVQMELFVEGTEFLLMPAIGKLQWGAWVDGDLIPLEPAKVIQHLSEGRLNMTIPLTQVDFILGVNSQEGGLFYSQQIQAYKALRGINHTFDGIPDNIYNDFMRTIVKSVTGNEQSSLAEMYEAAIDHQYRPISSEDATDIRRTARYTDVLSDLTFNMGVMSFARVHASFNQQAGSGKPRSNTFFYYFDHRGSWQSQESWRTGADHGDDVSFVFGFPFDLGLRSTSGEKSLSAAMMTMWSNFAKSGDPNSPTQVQFPVSWPLFTNDKQEYIWFRDDYTNANPVGSQLHKSRIYFWTDYFPRLRAAAPKTCTSPPMGD